MAIEHALTVLGWFENAMEDEVPPQNLWDDAEGLKIWWDAVKEKREARYGGGGTGSSGADDEMEGNELAAALKREY